MAESQKKNLVVRGDTRPRGPCEGSREAEDWWFPHSDSAIFKILKVQ
jgi:hypothetical protein